MRVWTVPVVIAGVLAMAGCDEPSEAAMRVAFEASLASDVQSALAYIAETGGEAALARVRAARTDAFDVRDFTKLRCAPSVSNDGAAGAHLCEFSVRIAVTGGELDRILTGRFYASPRGLVFQNEDAAAGA